MAKSSCNLIVGVGGVLAGFPAPDVDGASVEIVGDLAAGGPDAGLRDRAGVDVAGQGLGEGDGGFG
jgi:hypothetical protein